MNIAAALALVVCTVSRIDSVDTTTLMCADKTILDIPASEWPDKWEGPHEVGDTFLASVAGGRMVAMADCDKRLRAAIKAYCAGMYCRPPINSLMPDECR